MDGKDWKVGDVLYGVSEKKDLIYRCIHHHKIGKPIFVPVNNRKSAVKFTATVAKIFYGEDGTVLLVEMNATVNQGFHIKYSHTAMLDPKTFLSVGKFKEIVVWSDVKV